MGFQDGLDRRSQLQIGVTDDAGAGAHLAIDAAGAHRRHAVDELGLAHRAHLRGAVLSIHGAAFHVDCGDDVMAALHVGQQLVEQVARHALDHRLEAVAGRRPLTTHQGQAVPEMMVRVDDREVRIEHNFGA